MVRKAFSIESAKFGNVWEFSPTRSDAIFKRILSGMQGNIDIREVKHVNRIGMKGPTSYSQNRILESRVVDKQTGGLLFNIHTKFAPLHGSGYRFEHGSRITSTIGYDEYHNDAKKSEYEAIVNALRWIYTTEKIALYVPFRGQ